MLLAPTSCLRLEKSRSSMATKEERRKNNISKTLLPPFWSEWLASRRSTKLGKTKFNQTLRELVLETPWEKLKLWQVTKLILIVQHPKREQWSKLIGLIKFPRFYAYSSTDLISLMVTSRSIDTRYLWTNKSLLIDSCIKICRNQPKSRAR